MIRAVSFFLVTFSLGLGVTATMLLTDVPIEHAVWGILAMGGVVLVATPAIAIKS